MKNKYLFLTLLFPLFLLGQTNVQIGGFSKDFLIEVVKGNVPGHSIIHKFGAGTLTTSMAPISQSGFYRTPQSAVTLEVVSDDVDDNSTGLGAREITVTGLNSIYQEVTFTVATNGLTGVVFGTDLLRLYRWYVSSSGTYADQATGSHDGNLTIQVSGGGNIWSTIPISPFPVGQSQIGAVTIPDGYVGYLLSKNIFVDGSKNADVYFFKRSDIDDVTTPYLGIMRITENQIGISGGYNIHTDSPKSGFVGPCDLGFMGAMTTGTSDSSVEFEILIIQDGY